MQRALLPVNYQCTNFNYKLNYRETSLFGPSFFSLLSQILVAHLLQDNKITPNW